MATKHDLERLIRLEGGVTQAARALHVTRLTIYNWRTQTWEEVLDASGNAVTPLGSFQGQLGAPAPYIAQDGAVRVRLEAGGSGGIIVLRRLDLRAEGVRAP